MRVRTAVVPAAGLGTRFLPATLAVPKELLPFERRPAIHHIVAEAADAGIETVVLVLSRGKEGLVHYFFDHPDLDARVSDPGLRAGLEEVRELGNRVRMVTVYQEKALGLGHAVLTAAPAVGNEPFALMLPDDLFRPTPLRPLIAAYETGGLGGVALRRLADEEVTRYGIVRVAREEPPSFWLDGAVEKPTLDKAPSRLGIMGRYVLPPEVFDLLASSPPGVKGEIQITDSLHRLAKTQGMYGLLYDGNYLDLGTWEGYILANAQACAFDPEFATRLRRLLQGG